MERQGEEIHVTENEARAGSTPHVVRYVLVIGTLLAIVALSAIWITGALSMGEQEPSEPATTSQAAPATQ